MTAKLAQRSHRQTPNSIKLFTDGAVFSQLMQMRDGYLDGHDGEWIQSPEDFAISSGAGLGVLGKLVVVR